MFPAFLQLPGVLEKPVFDPKYLNMEYLFNKILQIARAIVDFFLTTSTGVPGDVSWGPLLRIMTLAGWVLAAALFFTVLWVLYRLFELTWTEEKMFSQKEKKTLESFDHTEHNIKWQGVLELLGKLSESDWRLAIIEADNILKELLDKMGYAGDSIGEQLKSVEPSDFLTLSSAWEAHKVRNRIAHEGTSFRLTHRDAQRIVGLFEKVFEEFHYI
ncbi:MAG: hypothetical protein A3J08_01195 [Candidatus Lloydbacteria bacterium RIFCSPLOWO2_02_FULL_51_11]|uniref:Uncharacterized protein n=1 Tax=Candidatus Lloydbacteria bacterium RIFCSPLOWO2_02_FULL_51_11 TaxID=1798667 RepID=A0A1G2DRR5_9BACT|nr:MAG: hypothetical protein A3J08_01195 [Candidatus Lloydbacteria bacterium RIFCSPLOWO2_02_FULL_51_11]